MTRYELLDRIGVGGMAEIFRGKAVAAGGFEKPVAIKRILPHLSQDKRFVELLIAEAKVLSLLKHRNIVQIFDVGLGDDGQYFLVMEYVDGKDLGAIQRGLEANRRRMPLDLALHIGAEICEALEHAHSARAPGGKSMSLVHRDVSPSNVLLSRAGEIKLTDFGIAKRAEQEATGHGAVRGKFAYISPEQARNEHIDPRSDVFSVAVVLWELLTNRRLFSGLTDLEALRAVREAHVGKPSEAERSLSGEVDALIMQALSRDAARRPTAGQFGAKLRSLRYSLEATVGDPATELAKLIDNTEQVERNGQQMFAPSSSGFDMPEHTEATVIRIRTADAFSMRDQDGTGLSAAREVIDRFEEEEEETRLAQLTGEQMRVLRATSPRDHGDQGDLAAPPPAKKRKRALTDEPTTARAPLSVEESAPMGGDGVDELPDHRFDSGERTRLRATPSLRTPPPERRSRPSTASPQTRSQSQRSHGSTASPPNKTTQTPPPGTVHNRNPHASQPQMQPPQPQQMQPPQPQQMQPPQPQQMQPPQPQQMQPPQPQQMQPQPLLPPQPQMQPQPLLPPLPMQPPMYHQHQLVPPQQLPPQGNYAMWGGGPQPHPAHDHHRPGRPARTNVPGGAAQDPVRKKSNLQPWMLVVGALIMAGLAFAITRAFIGGAGATKPSVTAPR